MYKYYACLVLDELSQLFLTATPC